MWKLESLIIQYKRLFVLKECEKHLQDRNNQNEILEPKHGGLLNLDDDSWDHWHQGGTQSIQFIMNERGLLFLGPKTQKIVGPEVHIQFSDRLVQLQLRGQQWARERQCPNTGPRFLDIFIN